MQLTTAVVLFSVLFPSKQWFAPSQPINVNVVAPVEVTLMLTDFAGKPFDAKGSAQVSGEKTVNLRELWDTLNTAGVYLLYAVPTGKDIRQFIGTPLVISVRLDKRAGAPTTPMVVRVQPLCYAVMKTDKGQIKLAFYYDSAPNTVDTVLRLMQDGFYDGLTFHRIVKGFVLQTGDPLGDGSGGPGFTIDAEFSDREHGPGVLSMARESDPIEDQGAPPRPEFANTAGSQFFICLDRARTKSLDRRFTVFGKVVEGMDVVEAIAQTPVENPETGTPRERREILSVQVVPVRDGDNPYAGLLTIGDETKRE